jgi:2-iminobutanoate/2-iminopropanoate deaminase
MKLKTIATDKAPAAIGPYSQAVQAGELVFFSGQIALDPATGEMIQGDVVLQAERVMANIAAVLAAAGADFTNVVKTTVFLVDMGDFAAVNEVYGRSFPDHKPARSTVAVKSLPRGALVEIEVIAKV